MEFLLPGSVSQTVPLPVLKGSPAQDWMVVVFSQVQETKLMSRIFRYNIFLICFLNLLAIWLNSRGV